MIIALLNARVDRSRSARTCFAFCEAPGQFASNAVDEVFLIFIIFILSKEEGLFLGGFSGFGFLCLSADVASFIAQLAELGVNALLLLISSGGAGLRNTGARSKRKSNLSLGNLLKFFRGSITSLGLLGLLGVLLYALREQDQLGFVDLEATDVLLQSLLVLVGSSVVNRDTKGLSGSNFNAGSLINNEFRSRSKNNFH